ncbi:hypothetical protein BJ165DRAFT_832410 [Panaeolus papilionaceus]|nr:hypothetical protein BJ165DRAFT_832410 [Panaeolus papilionaceus]
MQLLKPMRSISLLNSSSSATHSSELNHDGQVAFGTLPNGEEVKSTDVIIALMGPTGSGKTTFLNAATGAAEPIGTDLSSCTTTIVPINIPLPSDPNRHLILVDTPGFDNPQFSDVKVMQMIADWLKETFKQKILLSGLLYFHKISDNRLAGTPLANLRIFEEVCGRNAFSNVVLVTTMWNEINEKTGKDREEELRRKFWKKMINNRSTTKRFTGLNLPETARSILEPFIHSPIQRRLLLQDEMVNRGLDLPRTSAGKALHLKLGEVEQQRSLMMQRIGEDIQRGGLDDKSIESLEFDRQKLQAKSEETLAEIKTFKAPLSSLISDIVWSPHRARMTATVFLRDQIRHRKLTSDNVVDIRKRIRNNEQDHDLVVFVLGPTGSGKSSFINAVVGKAAVFVSEDGGLASVTNKVQTVIYQNVDGDNRHAPRICFVDVPAFNHSTPAVKDALPSQIKTWLEINVLGKKVDSAILYMNSLSSNRLNEPFNEHLEAFIDICQDKGHIPIGALLLQTEVDSQSLADEADEPFSTSIRKCSVHPAPNSIRFTTLDRPDLLNYDQKCNHVVKQLVEHIAATRTHAITKK